MRSQTLIVVNDIDATEHQCSEGSDLLTFLLESIHNGKNDGTGVQTNSKYDRGKGEILLNLWNH